MDTHQEVRSVLYIGRVGGQKPNCTTAPPPRVAHFLRVVFLRRAFSLGSHAARISHARHVAVMDDCSRREGRGCGEFSRLGESGPWGGGRWGAVPLILPSEVKKKCVFSLRFAESLRQVFFTYFCLFIFFFLFQISFPGPPAMWE